MRSPNFAGFNAKIFSLKLWLYSNLIGCLGWAAWLKWSTPRANWSQWLALTFVITFFSAGTSLLVAPLAAWLFTSISVFARAKRLFCAGFGVLFLWLLAVAMMTMVTSGAVEDFRGLASMAAPHLAAAYVATALAGRHWLFRANATGKLYDDGKE